MHLLNLFKSYSFIFFLGFISCQAVNNTSVEDFPKAETPTFSPTPGNYSTAQTVTISTTTPNATIFYALDGDDLNSESTIYTGPILLISTTTLKAYAISDSTIASDPIEDLYVIGGPGGGEGTTQTIKPTFSPSGGTYTSDQTVTLETTTEAAEIYYTTDGSTPSAASALYTGPITISGHGTSTTIKAIAIKEGLRNSDVESQTYVIEYMQLAAPVLTPAGGTFSTDQNIEMTSNIFGALIYYTTDGSTPTTASNLYVSPVPISGHQTTVTLKAIAVANGFRNSNVTTETYAIIYPHAETPTFSPVAGSYNTDQNVTLSTTTSGASIYYTTNGSTPTSSSTLYTSPIAVAGNGTTLTIRAIAIKSGIENSDVASATYTINYNQVATPVISPSGGVFNADQSITITTTTSGASIYYTTNNTTPTTSSTLYTGAFAVAGHGTSVTVRAIAVKSGMLDSNLATPQSYTITYDTVATPTLSPPGGTFATDQSVTISTTTSGATIHYTTNNTTPTTGSPIYTGPVAVAGHGTSLTIRALAVKSGMLNSSVSSPQTYTITYAQVATPQLTPSGGTFNADQSVTITTTTSGASIYYTTNGATPTTSSTPYTGPISVAGHGTSQTIRAIAVRSSMLDSAIASQTYTITYDQVAAPSMSPTAGTFNSDQNITISTTTSGATIYYTTNGTTPTTSSNVYSTPISIAGHGTSTTLRAIAVKAGMLNSNITTQSYTITYDQVATPVISPSSGYFENQTNVSISVSTSGATIYYTTNNSTPTTSSTLYSGPFSITATTTVKAIAVKSGMVNSAVNTTVVVITKVGFVYVDDASGNDTSGNGTDLLPYKTISRGITQAGTIIAGDSTYDKIKIRVGAANYLVSTALTLSSKISIYGGYDPDNNWSRDVVVNLTTITDNGISTDPRAPVICNSTTTTSTAVDGFKIVGFVTSAHPTYGIYVNGGSPIINDNTLYIDGGSASGSQLHVGIYSTADGSPQITSNTIQVVNSRHEVGVFVIGGAPLVFSNLINTSDGSVSSGSNNFGVAYDDGCNPTISNNTIIFGVSLNIMAAIGSWSGATTETMQPMIENNIMWTTSGLGTLRCIYAKQTAHQPIALNNNNLFSCTNALYFDDETDTSITTATALNNLSFADSNISFDMLTGSDTYFVDENENWHLQNGGSGTFLTVKTGGLAGGEAFDTFGVTTDRDGVTRTGTITGWSMGAYENNL